MIVRVGPLSRLLFSPRELPGTYYRGDGLGSDSYLSLMPDYRFRLSESGHMSLEDNEIARGRWQLDGDLVRLLPERRNRKNRDEARRMQVVFVPIKWEQRLYLIDEHETPAFCNLASTHSWHTNYVLNERRSFFHYLKLHLPNTAPKGYDGGRQQPYPPLSPDSRPLIPERYRAFYERGPIRARVVKVLPPASKTIPQTRQRTRIPDTALHFLLDRGMNAGLRPGLLLADRDAVPISDNLIVIAVGADDARAVRVDLPGRRWPLPASVSYSFSSGEWNSSGGRCIPYDTGWDWPPWAAALHEDRRNNTIEFVY